MRLPYAPSHPPADADPSTTEIYTRIAARRHPRPLIPLDLSLLHSPPVADGWNSFLGAIRTRTILPGALLELAVCRVAVLTGAVYEWNAHAPLALKDGVAAAALQAVREMPSTVEEAGRRALEASVLSAVQRAVVRYTDEMTGRVAVEEATFGALGEAGLGEREIVELTAGVAGYNCVSRVLVALDVGENNGKEMKSVEEMVAGLK
ncbi:carboxymuconolactone decarboxylase family protein [Aspergillus clavatus NRRL 1]|uniref:4-carboxymuconolactone decarboxylase, putative n=1 Tax=Aspergillus clavatus (strain ATCC 1007 / CBS 513.65 / DSM 816 / NCTC 3887 / NRRL 1 / QM 1276 / 107) TaxID=344612 RepID=A1CU42_ASPCL|nr:4-carboxymuconolactone decarboxylase, putative [Aspergillus clavatus NRRL 1]EAW06829.1 4-carboxymuconolactone decarboxylase, putative [Aspergillus clavatus NRRL 1]